MTLPVGLRAFHHADFRRFFWAQLVAQTGTWMQTVAQSWLVLQLTPSPFKLGLIGTLQFAPILLFSIASRRARRPRAQAARCSSSPRRRSGCQALGAGAPSWRRVTSSTGTSPCWRSARGFVNVLDQPARQSLVAEMVGAGRRGERRRAQLGLVQRRADRRARRSAGS